VQAGQDAGLLQVVHAVGEHAGGDDDEEQPGPREEDPQVQTHRTAVHEPAEADRRREPQGRSEQRRRRRASRLGAGPQEQRGLEALAPDGEQRHHDDGPLAGCDRGVEAVLQVRLEEARGARHPEDHPGDQTHRGDGERPADGLLRLERQTLRPEREGRAEGERDCDREADARPDRGEEVAPVSLDDVGDEDADDERGLEAFAQTDEEVGEHGSFPQGSQE
jgi:hypothetical protein